MPVIEIEHLTKTYHLGASRTSLREAVAHLARKTLTFGRNGHEDDDQLFYALNDVSFKVEQGEVLGIIGHNGAGKSTILKLLSKVTYPTSGEIRTMGRMAALIELGAGFHPDLTGRENIFLNGSILGLKKQEVEAEMDSIIEFAGLQRFIDTPIKRYSSGMYVRLAFSVAAHVKADLLLVDEVLSVGDLAFQQKSMAKMNELRARGATIVFVSHNLSAVQTFCDRVILLSGGQIVADGEPAKVIETYHLVEQEARSARLRELKAEEKAQDIVHSLDAGGGSGSPMICKIEMLNPAGQPMKEFRPDESVTIRCHYAVPDEVELPLGYLVVRRRVDGLHCIRLTMDFPEPTLKGEGVFEARLDQLLLLPGAYVLEAEIKHASSWECIAAGIPENFYISGRIRSETAGVFQPSVEWSFEAEKSSQYG
jgi:lipopolysaccharide transport system ATP-binding protein